MIELDGYKFKRYDSYIEFLQNRDSFPLALGGSDMSIIMGENRYSHPAILFDQKLNLCDPPNLDENSSVYWGSALEDVVNDRSQYYNMDNHKYMIEEKQRNHVEFPYTVQNDSMPFWFANADALEVSDQVYKCYKDSNKDYWEVELNKGNKPMPISIIEIKTMSQYTFDQYPMGLPYGYIYQVMSYMAQYLQMNPDLKGYIFSLVDGRDMHGYEIVYDQDVVDDMMEKSYLFHNLLKQGRDIIDNGSDDRQVRMGLAEIRPEPSDSDRLSTHMNENHLKKIDIENIAMGTDEHLGMATDYKSALESEKKAKSEKTLASNKIKSELTKLDVGEITLPDERGYIRFGKKLTIKVNN